MVAPEQDQRLGFGAVRRFGWGLADQAVSSLTNFALTLIVARSVNASALGVFSLAFSTYLIGLGFTRVFVSIPLSIRHSASSEEEWRNAARAATGTAVMIGLVAASISFIAGWAIGGPAGGTFAVLGAAFPGLLVQDAWRFAFFARSRGGQAFLNDLIWGLALLALLTVGFLTGRDSVVWLTAAWGAAAGIAALAGIAQARLIPAPRGLRRWYEMNRDLTIPLLGDSITVHATSNLSFYLIAWIAGVSALGALRAASVLLGPVRMIIAGVSLVAVPEGARSLARSPRSLRRLSVTISVVSGLGALAWGMLMLMLPTDIGRELLGNNWDEAKTVLAPLVFAAAASAAVIGATSGLKALQAAGRIFRTRIVESVIVLSTTAIGALAAGAVGVARAAAVSDAVTTSIWWVQFSRTLRKHRTALKEGRLSTSSR